MAFKHDNEVQEQPYQPAWRQGDVPFQECDSAVGNLTEKINLPDKESPS